MNCIGSQILVFGVLIVALFCTGCLEEGTTVDPAENDDVLEGLDPENDPVNESDDVINVPPSIVMNVTPLVGVAPLNVSASVEIVDTDEGCRVYWDFGDGNESNETVVQHRYNEPGEYIIMVMVVGPFGGADMKSVVCTVNEPPSDYAVVLKGAQDVVVNKSMFALWRESYEVVSWSDENYTWSGVPLYHIIGAVDDVESGPLYSFDEELASEGYTIRLTAGDGWVTEVKSWKIVDTDGYLIVDMIGNESLPEFTPKGKPSWPWHLRGSEVVCPNNIGNITQIELLDLPGSDDDGGLKNWWERLWDVVIPQWVDFFTDVFGYLFEK